MPCSGIMAWPEDKGVPSSPELLSSRIWCVNSLLTNRHSNCPYKTTSLRLMVLKICSAFCSTTPHGKSSTPARSPWAQAEPRAPGMNHGHRLPQLCPRGQTLPLSISCNFLFCWPLFWHFLEDVLTSRSLLFSCSIRAG